MSAPNLYAKILIQELIRHHLDYFCLAPGSRSTPLTCAIAHENQCTDFVHFDERGLAFHALGYAKEKGRAAPLFITSGSSLANLFPAVVESYQDRIPMLIFSADRPYEMRDCSSNQTIDQVGFFHKYARWHQDLPLFDKTCSIDFLATTVAQAIYYTKTGPVHINCQFREPFLENTPILNPQQYAQWERNSKPHTVFISSQSKIDQQISVDSSKKGIIITGRGTTEEDYKEIEKLALKIKWPIFSDILSIGRFGQKNPAVPYYDLIFKNDLGFEIESVLHFNGPYASKSLLKTLQKSALTSYYMISKSKIRQEPNHLPCTYYDTSPKDFCKQAIFSELTSSSSLDNWTNLSNKIEKHLNTYSTESNSLNEPFSIREILKKSEKAALFYIAASMPIRDALSFGFAKHPLHIHSNRGASGIDGNLATAFGISQAKNQPITVIIGDLAFLHDLNSLAQVKNLKKPPLIILINNSGGGIFSFLPIAKETPILKRYFQAEHSYTFDATAAQFDLDYCKPTSFQDLNKVLTKKRSKPLLIEIETQKDENYTLHLELNQGIKQCC